MSECKDPLVSVVVCCKNQAKTIDGCILSILRADYKKIELIVVDGGSTDGTQTILSSVAGHVPHGVKMRVLNDEGKGLAWARDLGFRASSGEYVAYCDGDKAIDRSWFTRMLTLMKRDDRTGGATDLPLVLNNSTISKMRNGYIYAYYAAYSFLAKINPRLVEYIRAGNSIWRRRTIVEAGGFDSNFGGFAEDIDMSHRIYKNGWVLCVTDATSLQLESQNVASLVNMFRRQGPHLRKFVEKHKRFNPWMANAVLILIGLLASHFVYCRTRTLLSLFWFPFLALFKVVNIVSAKSVAVLLPHRRLLRKELAKVES